jgi:esterase/lipase
MRGVAQTMVDAGYNVVVPRMPGHGFAVGGLLDARWEDWAAAVRIASPSCSPDIRTVA